MKPRTPDIKLINLVVYDKFLKAWDVYHVLKQAGIKSKIKTRHGVQVAVSEAEKAQAILKAERGKREMEAQAERCPHCFKPRMNCDCMPEKL